MKGKILLVDNSVPLSKSVEFTLSRNNYRVDAVSDEGEALNKLASGTYLLVIINLKDINSYGLKTLDFLQSMGGDSSLPVLGLTTPVGGMNASPLTTAGVTGWLAVPFSDEKLLNSIKKMC